jgi:hypothetical protein
MKSSTCPGGRPVTTRSNQLRILLLALCILLAMAVRPTGDKAETSRRFKAAADAKVLAAAVRRHCVVHSRLPTLPQLAQPDANGVQELEELPQDPWNRDYVLRTGAKPNDFVVVSSGPNGTLGDDDDIRSSDPPPR